MRPVDLARQGGISTQQVRNLEAAGVLPCARRTASGYRHYEDEHLRALLCYRAMASGYGTVVARQIMSQVHDGDMDEVFAEVDRHHAKRTTERLQLAETQKALRALNQHKEDSAASLPALTSIGSVARFLGVRTSTLRVWEQAGLLNPGRKGPHAHRQYSAVDVRDAQVVHLLRQSYYPFRSILPIVQDLRSAGGTERLQAVLEERGRSINDQSLSMLRGDAALYAYLSQQTKASTLPRF